MKRYAMKHSTKLIIWILIFAFSFGVIACGSDPEPNRVTEDPVAVVTAAPETVAEATPENVSAVAASTEHVVEVVVTPPPTPELPTLPPTQTAIAVAASLPLSSIRQ